MFYVQPSRIRVYVEGLETAQRVEFVTTCWPSGGGHTRADYQFQQHIEELDR